MVKKFLFLFVFKFSILANSEVTFWYNHFSNDGASLPNGDVLVEVDIAIPPILRGNPVPSAKLWPNGIIYYEIDNTSFLPSEVFLIKSTLIELEAKSNLKFQNRIKQSNYVLVKKLNGCYSNIGMIGGQQILSLGNGCLYAHTIMHEFMHASGILHEQSRSDRDKYIVINWANINSEQGIRNNFSLVNFVGFGKYDYKSIMHYPSYAPYGFSLNENVPILTKIDGGLIDWNKNITKQDIDTINFLYPIADTAREEKCLEIQYVDNKNFDRSLSNFLKSQSIEGVCISFNSEISINELPKRLDKWFSYVEKTGGKVEVVKVSRGVIWDLIKLILNVVFGSFEDIYAPAANYDVKVHVDYGTGIIQDVKFVVR